MPSQPVHARRIALLVETSREYGRGLLRGIIRYQREHGPWSIAFAPHGLDEPPPPWLTTWKGDGIIARINDSATASAVLRTGVPAVDLRASLPGLDLPVIGIDNQQVVALAIEHFLGRGFRHFAFCGTPYGQHRYQDERSDTFAAEIRKRGFACHVHEPAVLASWEQDQENLIAWLHTLPKPVAVMACHDDRGQQVLNACLRAGLSVPDDIAVLGVDNDEFLCHLTTPPLSSIDVDAVRIGYESAALLDRLMGGRKPPKNAIRFAPRRVVERQSTSTIAVEDPHVVTASRLIREKAFTSVNIETILGEVPLSRSATFRRFKSHLGRSPKQELTHRRIARARELLEDTSLSVSEIAGRTGYSESKYFIQVFRQQMGITPLQYRKKAKGSAARTT